MMLKAISRANFQRSKATLWNTIHGSKFGNGHLNLSDRPVPAALLSSITRVGSELSSILLAFAWSRRDTYLRR